MKLVSTGDKFINLDLVAMTHWLPKIETLELTLLGGGKIELVGHEARDIHHKLITIANVEHRYLVDPERMKHLDKAKS